MKPPSPPSSVHIQGYCDPRFAAVREAFANNFIDHNEIGASVAVIHQGHTVVDLWAGYQDADHNQPWEENTLVCVMSTTKAIASIAVLSLVDKGLIELEAPVARYWPEFAQANKQDITVRCLLAQLAGLPVADAAPANSYYQSGVVEAALAAQEPLWKPGTTPCYHSFTYGPLCQALIEKVTGISLGNYLRNELFGPLGIDFFVGLTQSEIKRCADVILDDGIPSLVKMRTPGTLLHRAWRPLPIENNFFLEERFRTCEFASANGHSNARALAQIYAALCQDINQNKRQLLSRSILEDVIQEKWDAVEQISLRPFRYGTGFMLNNKHFYLGKNPRSFGHPGLGGPLGFADPDQQLGFGYCCNRVHAIDNTGYCARNLVDATYAALNNLK